MAYSPLTIPCVVVLVAALCCFSISGAKCETLLFEDQQAGISLRFPEGFIEHPPPDPTIKLLIGPSEGGFPTFNLTEVPRPLDLSPGPKRIGERVVADYHSVGLTDAAAKGANMTEIGGQEAALVELGYKLGGQSVLARVILLPHGTRHLILTFLSTESSRIEALEQQIRNSFALAPAPALVNPRPESITPKSSRSLIILAVVLALLGSALGYAAYRGVRGT